jgi:hypothetical protein
MQSELIASAEIALRIDIAFGGAEELVDVEAHQMSGQLVVEVRGDRIRHYTLLFWSRQS